MCARARACVCVWVRACMCACYNIVRLITVRLLVDSVACNQLLSVVPLVMSESTWAFKFQCILYNAPIALFVRQKLALHRYYFQHWHHSTIAICSLC